MNCANNNAPRQRYHLRAKERLEGSKEILASTRSLTPYIHFPFSCSSLLRNLYVDVHTIIQIPTFNIPSLTDAAITYFPYSIFYIYSIDLCKTIFPHCLNICVPLSLLKIFFMHIIALFILFFSGY